MALNFGILKDVKVETVARFKPWSINEVNKVTSRVEHIQGKKDPSKTWDILKIRWEGPKGYFEESVFFPVTDKDAERGSFDGKDGKKVLTPSTLEHALTLVGITAFAVNPAGHKKMQEYSRDNKFKSFNDVCLVFDKVLKAAEGKVEILLKLHGKTDKEGNVVPILPKFCAISENGHLYTYSDPIMGKSVDFNSKWEIEQRDKFLNAKPTDMTKVETTNNELEVTENADLKGVDTDDLLNDINLD